MGPATRRTGRQPQPPQVPASWVFTFPVAQSLEILKKRKMETFTPKRTSIFTRLIKVTVSGAGFFSC